MGTYLSCTYDIDVRFWLCLNFITIKLISDTHYYVIRFQEPFQFLYSSCWERTKRYINVRTFKITYDLVNTCQTLIQHPNLVTIDSISLKPQKKIGGYTYRSPCSLLVRWKFHTLIDRTVFRDRRYQEKVRGTVTTGRVSDCSFLPEYVKVWDIPITVGQIKLGRELSTRTLLSPKGFYFVPKLPCGPDFKSTN